MTITYQILINIVVYAITVGFLYSKVSSKLRSHDEKIAKDNRVLYGQQGALNVIDQQTCKQHRDIIFAAIRRSEKASEMSLDELKQINKSLIKLETKIEFMTEMNMKKRQDD